MAFESFKIAPAELVFLPSTMICTLAGWLSAISLEKDCGMTNAALISRPVQALFTAYSS